MDIRYDHDGLQQKVTTRYAVKNGHRVETEKGQWVREVSMNLPRQIVPEVWLRYGYTIDDVSQILSGNSSRILYMLGMLLGPFGYPPSQSAIKISFMNSEDVIFASTAVVKRKIIRHVAKCMKLSDKQSPLEESAREFPPLPVYTIGQEQYNDICKNVPQDVYELGESKWIESFEFRDVEMVPISQRAGAVTMMRVVDPNDYRKTGRKCNSIATRPMSACVGRKRKFGLIEEECKFIPRMSQ